MSSDPKLFFEKVMDLLKTDLDFANQVIIEIKVFASLFDPEGENFFDDKKLSTLAKQSDNGFDYSNAYPSIMSFLLDFKPNLGSTKPDSSRKPSWPKTVGAIFIGFRVDTGKNGNKLLGVKFNGQALLAWYYWYCPKANNLHKRINQNFGTELKFQRFRPEFNFKTKDETHTFFDSRSKKCIYQQLLPQISEYLCLIVTVLQKLMKLLLISSKLIAPDC